MSEHYVPILKGKAGEFAALAELPPALRDRITPLVDIPRVPIANRDKPLDAHLDKTLKGIARGWGTGQSIFVDLFDIDLGARATGGVHPVSYVFRKLHEIGFDAIPVIGLDRDRAYEDAVRVAAARVEASVLRLLPEDLEAAGTLLASVDRMLASIKTERAATHLVLDLRSVRDRDVSYYVGIVARAVRALAGAAEYASVILAGSSVPQSLAEDVGADSMGRIPRKELAVWRRLRATPGVGRRLTFGDYGVVHPDNLDLDPRAITLAASIRYTSNDDMVILRGKSFKSHPDGYGQYYDLAKLLVSLPDFRGAKFSWGDQRVAACAARSGKTGSKTTWVTIATSHHLAQVSDQLGRAA